MHIDPDSPHYDDFRDFQSKLKTHLRELRKENGYTQRDLIESGVSKRNYERMEQEADSLVSLWQLYKIAKFYDCTISELLDIE